MCQVRNKATYIGTSGNAGVGDGAFVGAVCIDAAAGITLYTACYGTCGGNSHSRAAILHLDIGSGICAAKDSGGRVAALGRQGSGCAAVLEGGEVFACPFIGSNQTSDVLVAAGIGRGAFHRSVERAVYECCVMGATYKASDRIGGAFASYRAVLCMDILDSCVEGCIADAGPACQNAKRSASGAGIGYRTILEIQILDRTVDGTEDGGISGVEGGRQILYRVVLSVKHKALGVCIRMESFP